MIRSSNHTLKYSNTGKLSTYSLFRKECERVVSLFIDYLWSNEIIYKNKVLNISKQLYDCPSFLTAGHNKCIPSTWLSARALKACSSQACSIMQAVLKTPARRAYMLTKLQAEGKLTTNLQNKISKQIITKPIVKNLNIELDSNSIEILNTDNYFDMFINLKSFTNQTHGKKIYLPLQHHRQSNKLKAQGKLLKGVSLRPKTLTLRWELPTKSKKKRGKTLGADQGLNTIITFSNNKNTPKTNNHGHSLHSITKTLARKKKGSKAFGQTQAHRENFINWSINQLSFKGVKQVNVEKIVNIGYKHHTSRFLSHWNNTLIRDKLLKVCEEQGVLVVQRPSAYKSQRCFGCGLVKKSNRKGEEYKCGCGNTTNADLNSALNQTLNLLPIPNWLFKSKLNKSGFYWTEKGLFNLNGEALTVPLSIK